MCVQISPYLQLHVSNDTFTVMHVYVSHMCGFLLSDPCACSSLQMVTSMSMRHCGSFKCTHKCTRWEVHWTWTGCGSSTGTALCSTKMAYSFTHKTHFTASVTACNVCSCMLVAAIYGMRMTCAISMIFSPLNVNCYNNLCVLVYLV